MRKHSSMPIAVLAILMLILSACSGGRVERGPGRERAGGKPGRERGSGRERGPDRPGGMR